MSTLVTNTIKNSVGTTVIDFSKILATGRYRKNIYTQVDTSNYSATNAAWVLGPSFPIISGFQANSLVKLTYVVPTRNDTTSWGGGYIEPQVNFNSSGWQSLGSCGYDAGCMALGNAYIGTYRQTILIDPGLAVAFTTQFRFYFKAYDGTIGLNNALGHEINANSATASITSGNNGLQHFFHIIVEELARYN